MPSVEFKIGFNREGNNRFPRPYLELRIGQSVRDEKYERDEFQEEAENFTELFDIAKRFKYSPAQLELFETYFAGYFALKSNHEKYYLVNRPEMENIKHWPMVGRLVRAMGYRVVEQDETGKEYLERALRQEVLMREDPKQQFINLLVNLYPEESIEEIIDEFREDDGLFAEETRRDLPSEVGLPDGIQRYANYLTAIWINPDKLKREDLRVRTELEIDELVSPTKS